MRPTSRLTLDFVRPMPVGGPTGTGDDLREDPGRIVRRPDTPVWIRWMVATSPSFTFHKDRAVL